MSNVAPEWNRHEILEAQECLMHQANGIEEYDAFWWRKRGDLEWFKVGA